MAFPRATQAVAAAVEAQRQLAEHTWPEGVCVRVRMGLHTGEPWNAEEGYVGIDVHRAARIAHVGHGGQVLLSETATALVLDELSSGVSLLDLGRHLLKDIHRPERIHQLVIEGLPSEFPPLTSLEALPPKSARRPHKVGACPYRGLSAFQETDASFYFGRESFVTSLQQAIRTRKLVVVIVGSSGSGKSSALFAGLLPRLRAEKGWQIVVLRPGSQPFYALAGALMPLLEPRLSENELLVEVRTLAENLHKAAVRLPQVIERVLKKEPSARQVLLVVDQFEELYTLCPEADIQRLFVDMLLETGRIEGERRISPLVVLLTMRADFMGQALAYRPFADSLQEASLLMGPMRREELRVAIAKPAEMQGAAFEPGLVERILDDVGSEPGNLPLLEFALTLLWERQSDGWLTHADYEALGCVDGALACYADQVFDGLEPDDQERAHRALVQLVRPGEGTEDTRRVASRDELGDERWQLIQHLADQRLVVTGLDASGTETAEVVHEALIRNWGRFRGWMAADRAFRSWQERLRSGLRQWQANDRDEGALLRGAPLVEAEDWLEGYSQELSANEQEFIQVSVLLREREASERENQHQRELEAARQLAETQSRAAGRLRRRAMYLLAALATAALLAAAAVFFGQQSNQNAKIARQNEATAQSESQRAEGETLQRATQQAIADEQAQLARSRELAAASVNKLQIDPELSILLALQALRIGDTIEARSSLHQALRAYRLVARFPAHESQISGVSFDPQGGRFASASADGLVKIWGMGDSNGRPAPTLQLSLANPLDFDITSLSTGSILAFCPDSSCLAAVGEGNRVNFWDPVSGLLLQSITDLDGLIQGISFSTDGKRLVTTNEHSWAKVWDVLTGWKLQTVIPPADEIVVAEFTPDGKQLVTVGDRNKIRFWDLETDPPKEIFSRDLGQNMNLRGQIAFSPDGKNLAATGLSGGRVWNMGELGKNPAVDPRFMFSGYQGNLNSLLYTSDGSRLITGSGGEIRLWDASNGQALFRMGFTAMWREGYLGNIISLAMSPDGIHLASAQIGSFVNIYDISPTGGSEWWKTHPANGGRFSPDGKRMATVFIPDNKGNLQIRVVGADPRRRRRDIQRLIESRSDDQGYSSKQLSRSRCHNRYRRPCSRFGISGQESWSNPSQLARMTPLGAMPERPQPWNSAQMATGSSPAAMMGKRSCGISPVENRSSH